MKVNSYYIFDHLLWVENRYVQSMKTVEKVTCSAEPALYFRELFLFCRQFETDSGYQAAFFADGQSFQLVSFRAKAKICRTVDSELDTSW